MKKAVAASVATRRAVNNRNTEISHVRNIERKASRERRVAVGGEDVTAVWADGTKRSADVSPATIHEMKTRARRPRYACRICLSLSLCRREWGEPDVAEADGIAVVLQADRATLRALGLGAGAGAVQLDVVVDHLAVPPQRQPGRLRLGAGGVPAR